MESKTSLDTKNIYQLEFFNAAPSQVYNVWMNGELFSQINEMKASVDDKIGGSFSYCNNLNFGLNVMLNQNNRIVQAWSHRDFPQQHFSILDISIEQHENGCYVYLNHHGVPAQCFEMIAREWQTNYFIPMQLYFDNLDLAKSMNDLD